jgi:hypothetical protein
MNKGKRWERKLKNAKERDTMINYYEYNCKTACIVRVRITMQNLPL